jgi:hypothetical protein
MTNQEFIEQHEQKDKLVSILSKFKNGIELYRTDSFFSQCIDLLMRDADPVYLVGDLYKLSVELKDTISHYEKYMRINNNFIESNPNNITQQFIKDESNSEYRIKEYNGEFQIQRKRIQTITTGILWWKKLKEVVTWEAVDKHGRFLTLFNGELSRITQIMQSYPTIEQAKAKLNIIKEGAKYHY